MIMKELKGRHRMNLIVKCIFSLAVVVLVILFPASAESAIVRIDSVEASPGESFSVGLWLTDNTDDLSAMTIPLRYNHLFLTLDSVSFTETILTDGFNGVVDHNPDGQSLRISYIIDDFALPLPTISTSQGLLASLHFTLGQGASPDLIAIDSIFKDSVIYFDGNEIHFWTRVEFSDQTGTFVTYPEFIPGAINVMISTAIDNEFDNLLPAAYALAQNYPNPFNPSTSIDYSLPRAGYISLKVFNVIGQEVATIYEGFQAAGNHRVEFQASNKPSGIYFYRLTHQDGSETKKMLLVK